MPYVKENRSQFGVMLNPCSALSRLLLCEPLMRCNAGLIQFDVHFLIRDICVRSVAVHFQTGRLSLLLIWHKYDFYF